MSMSLHYPRYLIAQNALGRPSEGRVPRVVFELLRKPSSGCTAIGDLKANFPQKMQASWSSV